MITPKRLVLLALIVLILGVLSYKAYDEGWFFPRTPLVLNDQPAVLFFNRHKGCACELVVYQAAEGQMQAWPDEKLQGVQLIEIDLDRRPDLGKQYHVVRAPALLLLDDAGELIYRQNEIVADHEPLDLPLLEQKLMEMFDG